MELTRAEKQYWRKVRHDRALRRATYWLVVAFLALVLFSAVLLAVEI